LEELDFQNFSWLNRQKSSVQKLLDKPLLISFWRPACYDCVEDIRFINLLYDTYSDKGLVVIGVCISKFEFEKDPSYVKAMVRTLRIRYQVALADSGVVCELFGIRRCPSNYLYLNRRLVYDHVGAGGYYELEAAVRDLLSKAKLLSYGRKTPYNGSLRLVKDFISGFNQGRLNVTPNIFFNDHNNALPKSVVLQGFSESGQEKFCSKRGSQAMLKVQYKGRRVDAVLSSRSSRVVAVEVLLDGDWVKAHMLGEHTTKHSNGCTYVFVGKPGLYGLIEAGWGNHELLLRSSDGFCVYAVTFR
jgi:thiol-disulfide isomerase/thioredoxin